LVAGLILFVIYRDKRKLSVSLCVFRAPLHQRTEQVPCDLCRCNEEALTELGSLAEHLAAHRHLSLF
jgi:hypothetical protein